MLISAFNLAQKNINLKNLKFSENFNEFIKMPFFVQIDDSDCLGYCPDYNFSSKTKKIGHIQGYLSRLLLKHEINWQEYFDLAQQAQQDLT